MMNAEAWQGLLRHFKEKLAERLWGVPSLSETEKELLFREYLSDLDALDQKLAEVQKNLEVDGKRTREENDLLRSLLGVSENDLKSKTLILSQDNDDLKKKVVQGEDETRELNDKLADAKLESDHLRKRVHELEKDASRFRSEQLRRREDDVRFFSESHDNLKNELKDLESRLANLRTLFAESNQKLLADKQEEIALLQKKLLEEMEAALRRKLELSWGEEEMFAKGVAQKVRTALIAAQGQLLLTLERLGLLDPESKNESFWKARLRLLVDGADELAGNFRAVQAQIQDVTNTLDDYLHLTRRRDIAKEPVLLKELVQAKMGEIYADRKPSMLVEFLSDDPMPSVPGDPALLRFVIETLLQNAMEALPGETGKIIVALKNQSDRGRVSLIVHDSGAGIPDHLQPRLFEPFFTTKDRRQGLSLSRAKRYVEFHGGKIQVISTGQTGTMFQVELPLNSVRLTDEGIKDPSALPAKPEPLMIAATPRPKPPAAPPPAKGKKP